MVCSSDQVLRSVRISNMARVCGWLLVVRLVVELAVPGVCYARVCGCLQLKRWRGRTGRCCRVHVMQKQPLRFGSMGNMLLLVTLAQN